MAHAEAQRDQKRISAEKKSACLSVGVMGMVNSLCGDLGKVQLELISMWTCTEQDMHSSTESLLTSM